MNFYLLNELCAEDVSPSKNKYGVRHVAPPPLSGYENDKYVKIALSSRKG